MTSSGNLFSILPGHQDTEQFAALLSKQNVRIERIVSSGQASPSGFWYDQTEGEWIVLLVGEARLLIDGENAARTLEPGDWIDLPPHCRHRVEWTSSTQETIWLAVYYR